MFRYLWLRPLAHRCFGCRGRTAFATRAAVSSRRRVRPCLETLEDRITPNNTFTPTTFADDGSTTSLRGDITQANNDTGTGTDTIQLAPTSTTPYTLTIDNSSHKHEQGNASGDLNITSTKHTLVIAGTTDANGNPTTTIHQKLLDDRVFQIVNPGTTVIFKDLIIEGGDAQDNGTDGAVAGHTDALGGGILDDGGNVMLSNVVLKNNAAQAGNGFSAQGGGIYEGGGGSLTIQSSVIELDNALGDPHGTAGRALGGGVAAKDQTTINNSTLAGNFVTGGNGDGIAGGTAAGGGIAAFGLTKITHSTLEGNRVTGGDSDGRFGGSAEGGGVFAVGNTTILACTLSGNILQGGQGNLTTPIPGLVGDAGGEALGGSVYASQSSTTNISASILSGNSLTGGIGNLDNSSASITGDIGGEAHGGGVYASGPTTINTSILSDNTLTGGGGTFSKGSVTGTIGGSASGGGVYVSSSKGTASIAASTLSGNTVTGGSGSGGSATPGTAQGGGADFESAGNTLVNTTIANNQVIGGQGTSSSPVASGGGLFFGNVATATLTNVTVALNNASLPPSGAGSTNGGGIDNTNTAALTITLVNTLVALNSAGTDPDYAGTVSNSDHNLIGIAVGSTGFSAAHGDLLGSSAKPLYPHLGTLANNGGTLAGAPGSQQVMPTLALLPGSPAINAGDNSALSVTGLFDQRGPGFPRVVGSTIDIGAFEFQPPPPSSTPPPTLHTPPLLAFFDALLGAVETINGNKTETVTDSIFGIPLIVSLYDGAGNLLSVTLLGINVTALFELL